MEYNLLMMYRCTGSRCWQTAHNEWWNCREPSLACNMISGTRPVIISCTEECTRQERSIVFLRAPAAQALAAVQAELSTRGYGLKLFDGYRPYGVTVRFWELVKDERYVANPTKGSGHNRGLAADLTIIELSSGKELDMGTGFDNFTDSAHQGFTGLPPAVQENRQLLRKVMVKHGFTPLETEWWHYYWPNDKDYAVLDLDFAALLRYP